MVTKKKPVNKKETKKEIKKEEIQIYKPVFPKLEFKFTKKVDANYYGIKQYLKNRIGIDLFKKLKNGSDKPKEEITKKQKERENNIMRPFKPNFLENIWIQYKIWWNYNINHIQTDGEDYRRDIK